MSSENLSEEVLDVYRELSNVALGQAASSLASLLDVFVNLPIPVVNVLEPSELHMALNGLTQSRSVSSVCQGFIGSNISGEALIIFNDASFNDLAKLSKYIGEGNENVELEILMDVSNILIGAYLKGFAEQLDIKFSQGQPVVLGQHLKIEELIEQAKARWTKTLAIEVNYTIENHNINCDLLLLFTEDSIKTLIKKANYLLE